MPLSPYQREQCEALIDKAMQTGSLSRELAIVALGIRDMERLRRGLPTQIDGVNFRTAFGGDSVDDLPIHVDDVARIVAFVEGVPIEVAKQHTQTQVESGVWPTMSVH